MDPKQTPNSDPSNIPAGGNGNAPGANATEPSKPSANADVHAGTPDASLSAIEQMTGRKFASLDEAHKHYQSLNSLVGDNTIAEQRKRAAVADNLANRIAKENGWSLEAAYLYLEDLQSKGNTPDGIGNPDKTQFDPQRAETDARVRRLERENFLTKHPEAQAVIVQLDEYTKTTGKPIEEAFNTLYGGVVANLRESVRSDALREEKKGATVQASTSAPVPPEPDLYADNMKKYQATGNKEFFREAIKHKWNRNESLKRRVQATT